MENFIKDIIKKYGSDTESLIALLQAIQKQYNYLPDNSLKLLSEHSQISLAEIAGVAGFYSQFRFEPAGKHLIKVCSGTACHIKGSGQVYDSLHRKLNIPKGHDTDPDGLFTLEKVNCLGCCTLAPVVQIDDITYGHVAAKEVANIIEDFKNKISGKKSKTHRKQKLLPLKGEIRIGLGSCCVASGSEDIRQAVEETINQKSLAVTIKQVGCVGVCNQVPLLEILPNDKPPKLYAKVKASEVKRIISRHFKSDNIIHRLKTVVENWAENIQSEGFSEANENFDSEIREKHISQFLGNQIPVATEHRGILNPLDIEEYTAKGGFEALKKALKMEAVDIIEEVKTSGIRGRGGAGYPTGLKWESVFNQGKNPKYIICNGDEGDPGAFMDRMLLESYPYRIIEGMLIAAKATSAEKAFFYIRAEYPLAVKRIREAIQICRNNNIIGENILGSGFSLEIEIKEGAGAFVCGEETAMIAAMSGKRGFPKYRPPYPAENGLHNCPTLINNTETFAQIPYILRNGHERFSSIGTLHSKGVKVFALAGKVERGGLIEVPLGVSIRHIVEDIGGGIQKGRKLKAVQIGGPSGGCIPHFLADLPIDFDSLTKEGSMMGSGGMIVLDDSDCMVEIARYFLSFSQKESCGKCTFCRIGTRRMLDIMEKLCEGNAREKHIEELNFLAKWTKKGSLCGLGKTAANPVLSTLRHFHQEYIDHINGKCPAGKCKALITYSINSNCIGCTKCAQACPAEAIPFTPHQKHQINTSLCIKCDNCKQVCPQNAVDVF